VLSGDKEERVDLMTLLIRNLLKENKDLRAMLKNMTSFVGEGQSNPLPTIKYKLNFQVLAHVYLASVSMRHNSTQSSIEAIQIQPMTPS